TKKTKQRGFNGNANVAYTRGRYANTSNSINLNYRNNKFNYFANYSINYNQGYNNLTINRGYLLPDGATVWRNFEQPTYIKFDGRNNNLKAGIDYYLNKQTTLGIVAGGFISPRNIEGSSRGYWQDANRVTDSATATFTDNSNRWKNGYVNLNLRHEIDKNSELTADLDHVRYDMENQQLFTNEHYNKTGQLTSSDQIRGALPAGINIYSLKADYSRSFSNKMKAETGVKTSHVKTDNLAQYDERVLPNGQWTPDYEISNHFTYEEDIYAAYGNLRGSMGKWEWQAGLRLEHTSYNGYQAGNPLKDDSAFTRSYTSLFPTGFLSYKADTAHTFTINTGRRIQRPAYQQLNPFKFFINEFTYQEGNPYLQPQFTTNIELSHSYKGKVNTTLGYADTRQLFSQVFRPEGPVTILTEGNLGRRRNTNLSVNVNHEWVKGWTMNLSGTGNHLRIEGEWMGNEIQSEGFNWSANMNNQFRFGKGWSGELSGFYNSKVRDGQFTIAGFGQVSAGIGKQVLKNKGSIRLNMRDIFWTQKIDGRIKYGEVRENFYQFRDSRQVTLSLQYRFGKPINGEKRRNGQGGATEEQNRVRVG
ncbi:MAG TPA: outer membrane beta-barrel family protein, partial [Phnomibacter sp.]|nr:outer membrane beta-barrel family protein [Phnomibacter sp.]